MFLAGDNTFLVEIFWRGSGAACCGAGAAGGWHRVDSTTTGCLCPMTWSSWAANTGPGSSPVSQEIPNPHCKWTWFIPDAHRFNDSESCSLKMGFTAQSHITFQRKTWTPLSAKNQWGFSEFISVRILCRSNYSVLLESWFCFSAEENVINISLVWCPFGRGLIALESNNTT